MQSKQLNQVLDEEEKQKTQRDLYDWTDVIAIDAGLNHTVGMKSDGTLITCGSNDSGQRDIENWSNIAIPNK